jgi:hypothetical protein
MQQRFPRVGWRLLAAGCLMSATTAGLFLAYRTLVPSGRDPQPASEGSIPPWFIDITDEVGLDFVHDAGPIGSYFLPQIMGSGAALFDFNNDGLLDIYLLQNGGPHPLQFLPDPRYQEDVVVLAHRDQDGGTEDEHWTTG